MRKLKKEVIDIVATVAPSLATALGGPLAGLAAREVAEALTGDALIDEDQIESAIEFGNAEDLLKLREVEANLKAKLKDAGVELERIAASDRDSARQRQVATKDRTPAVLGLAIIIGFFGMLAYMMRYGLPESGSEVSMVLIGALSTMTIQVGNFFFGSSTGSKSKDNIIASMKGASK